MAYLEELLTEFRKGAKIRCDYWDEEEYIQLKKDGYVYDEKDDRIDFSSLTIFGKSWELYKEPEPDWDYIIKNKCLCWFGNETEDYVGFLDEIDHKSTHKFIMEANVGFRNCRPVRREEVIFYKDRIDE